MEEAEVIKVLPEIFQIEITQKEIMIAFSLVCGFGITLFTALGLIKMNLKNIMTSIKEIKDDMKVVKVDVKDLREEQHEDKEDLTAKIFQLDKTKKDRGNKELDDSLEYFNLGET